MDETDAVTRLRTALQRAIAQVINAVGGDGACIAVGYQGWTSSGSNRTQHQFFALVGPKNRGAVIGAEGSNVRHIRALIKTRASVEGSRDPVDLHIVLNRDEVEGVAEWVSP